MTSEHGRQRGRITEQLSAFLAIPDRQSLGKQGQPSAASSERSRGAHQRHGRAGPSGYRRGASGRLRRDRRSTSQFIVQCIDQHDQDHIVLCVDRSDLEVALRLACEVQAELCATTISFDPQVATLGIYGPDFRERPGIAGALLLAPWRPEASTSRPSAPPSPRSWSSSPPTVWRTAWRHPARCSSCHETPPVARVSALPFRALLVAGFLWWRPSPSASAPSPPPASSATT